MVRLIHPRFVKPFVKGSKNDAVDADAIYEAALRPTMRFGPVKTTEQQDLQMIHRTRDRLITQRTALINHIRGLLAEYGVVMPVGAFRFRNNIADAVASATLPGVGPVVATALVAAIDDGRHFASGRVLAAWIGLVASRVLAG